MRRPGLREAAVGLLLGRVFWSSETTCLLGGQSRRALRRDLVRLADEVPALPCAAGLIPGRAGSVAAPGHRVARLVAAATTGPTVLSMPGEGGVCGCGRVGAVFLPSPPMVMQAVAAALGIPGATAVLYGRRREAVLVAASDATARAAHDLEAALGEGAAAAAMAGGRRVTRLLFPGRTVIRKEPLGPDGERRLRHEMAILERLRGVEGVAQLAEAPRYPGSIVVADVGGTSLAGPALPLAVDDLTGLAVGLARAVAGMHRRGVTHRDVTPANILISRDGALCLVDFALATSFAEIRPEFTHHTEIVGTLAYLAPEQTGRTGRPVDQRADLYALGATLYELATGEPPFGSGDPLRLTHDHLARVPVPPAEVNRAVPGPLSAIIMHLLEKEPDNRYQTADGVVYDLERLRDAQARPAAAGRCRGVLVRGAPGVGKTALADELRPVVTAGDGWFVVGKFDQYRRDLEFDAVYQAFRALGRLLLAEPEDELAEVRGRILEAVGPNAGLLTAVLPEFAALLGVPPDPGDPLTAQVRARRAGVEVLRAVASRKRPVVLFVDDLQWAGRTPLGLVDLVLNEEPVEGLLLVGAYREDDVDTAHPLAALLSRLQDQAAVQHLRLVKLPVPSLITMVAEMLHVDPATAAGLAEVIEPHTRGNPYETVELLNALRRDGVLTATAAGWRWDAAAVRAHLGQSEVAGLLAARVEAMPAASRAMVEAMACLGGRAEVSLLQAATGGALCSWRWRGGWPGCRSCSRSRRSSTCRWPMRSMMPWSGARWWGCCGVPPARPR